MVERRGAASPPVRAAATGDFGHFVEHAPYFGSLPACIERWYELEQRSGQHLLTECGCLNLGLPEGELVTAAHDCDVVIAYRQTPAPASFFAAMPRLAAFIRCAMDIRTVDVAAASAHGVLVTRASAGFQAETPGSG